MNETSQYMNDAITSRIAAHIKVQEDLNLGASGPVILLRKIHARLAKGKNLSASQRAAMYSALNVRVKSVDKPLLARLSTLIDTEIVSDGVRRILEDLHEQVSACRPLSEGQYDVITRTESRLSSARAVITDDVRRHMRWARYLSRQTGEVKPYNQRVQDRLTRIIDEFNQPGHLSVLFQDDYAFVRTYFRNKFKEAEDFKFRPGVPVRIRNPHTFPPEPPDVGVIISTPDVIKAHNASFHVDVLNALGEIRQVMIDRILPLKESTKKH